jgi:hypothetical protein
MVKPQKNKTAKMNLFFVLLAPTASHLILPQLVSHAQAASAQISGQAAVVGEFASKIPPATRTFQGWRVPFGLTLEGKPTNNVSLFLDLRYSLNSSPNVASSLGNTSPDGADALKGNEVNQPFTTSGGRGEKFSSPTIGYAFAQYVSDVGLFRAGRIPQHWGLGIWRNADWLPEGGTLSTADAISATFDLTSTFSGSIAFEKNSEGSVASLEDDSDAFTVNALLADDVADVNSSGVTRQIGIAFQAYSHKQSSTNLKTLDVYSKIYVDSFGVEGEILYPTGETKSLGYSVLGGKNVQCAGPKNQNNLYISCENQKYEGFAALFKLRYQLGGKPLGVNNSVYLAATDEARAKAPTSLVSDSHIASLWFGYARGDKDGFANSTSPDSSIQSTPLHPNIRPSLLMFQVYNSLEKGMPGSAIQNSLFVRGDYSYETAGFGQINTALIWAQLDKKNENVSDNSIGTDKNLGVEINLGYQYRTVDKINFGIDSGLWVPGKAWQPKNGSKPGFAYGVRTTASTEF